MYVCGVVHNAVFTADVVFCFPLYGVYPSTKGSAATTTGNDNTSG